MMPKPANKPTLAVDIDEVLFPMVDDVISYVDREHGVVVTPEEFTAYNLEDIWHGGPLEGAKVFEAYKSQSSIEVVPVKGAAEALIRLTKKFNVIVMTSRDNSVREKTAGWIDHHFPEIFNEVHMLGNKEDSVQYREKADVCRELGVYCLIDDSLRHVVETNQAGIKAILFGDYPWNQTDQLPKGVARLNNWQEVLEYFENEKG